MNRDACRENVKLHAGNLGKFLNGYPEMCFGALAKACQRRLLSAMSTVSGSFMLYEQMKCFVACSTVL